MKVLFIATILTGLVTMSANAETFTGTNTGIWTNRVMAQTGGGKPAGSSAGTFAGKTVMANGQTNSVTGACGFLTTDRSAAMDIQGFCNYSDASGDVVSMTTGCLADKKNPLTEMDCWAGGAASAGPHVGKTMTMTWHTTNSADGKSSANKVVGQWND